MSTERQPRNPVFHSAARPAHDLRAEADRETLHMQPAPARGEEMAQFVDEDRASEEEHEQHDRPDIREERTDEFRSHPIKFETWD
jgi:hypothetical protein